MKTQKIHRIVKITARARVVVGLKNSGAKIHEKAAPAVKAHRRRRQAFRSKAVVPYRFRDVYRNVPVELARAL